MSGTADHSIFWPVMAQVGLVAAVWVRLYYERAGEIALRKISLQSIATSRLVSEKLENVAASDNFRNLFEMPVLFFAVCLSLAVTGLASPAQVGLAWAFVGLRAIHSFIHVTYNRVMHRHIAYSASTFCLFAMWILFAVGLASHD